MRLVIVGCVIAFATCWVGAFDTTFTDEYRFLNRYVCDGGVDYHAVKADPQLDTILERYAALRKKQFKAFSENVRLAALINLYNLATIKLIVDHFPVKSIKEIPDAWKKKRVDFLGKKYNLPGAISDHNNYWLWGPGDTSGETIIFLGGSEDRLREVFVNVEKAAVFTNAYVMPYENNLPIYVCKGLKTPLEVLWPQAKHFE